MPTQQIAIAYARASAAKLYDTIDRIPTIDSSNEGGIKPENITAVVKKVVGTHYFLAIFGPIGAHFSPHSRHDSQPHRESQSYSRREEARIWLNLKMMKVEVF